MGRSVLAVAVSLALLGTLSCSKAPTRVDVKKNGSGDGSAEVPKDPFKEPEKLSLSSISQQVEANFDLSKSTEISWINAQLVVFAHSDGTSLSYDFERKSWGSVHTSDLHSEYQLMMDFRDAGFFAFNDDQMSLRLKSGKILQLKTPDGFDAKNIVGANPGFVAFKSGDDLSAVLSYAEGARLYPMSKAPAGINLVYPCNLHCIVWGFDGSRISIFMEREGWKQLEQTIELPPGEEVSRMAIRFRSENNPVAAESIIVSTPKGSLFAQVAGSAPKEIAEWEDIKKLSERYCVSCHAEDGYDKERTWTDLKSSIVTRLKAMPGSQGAMPPIETKKGQEMSSGERATMLVWIEKQIQTERGEIGDPNSGGDNGAKISGDLKRLAEANCNSCHADATTVGWWKMRKASVVSQVNSGKMPKNKVLSAAVKKEFETAVNALK